MAASLWPIDEDSPTGEALRTTPGVWFVRMERIPPEGPPTIFWEIAPDLVVEVLSPSPLDRFHQVILKVRDYVDADVRLTWVIDPESRCAFVFAPGRPNRFVADDGALDGEHVLPGFALTLFDAVAAAGPRDQR